LKCYKIQTSTDNVSLSKQREYQRRYILKRRSEEIYRIIERSKDVSSKRKRRNNEDIRKHKQAKDSSRRRINRQVIAKKAAEQAKDSSRRRITRQMTAKRNAERTNDALRKRIKRQNSLARKLSQAKDTLRRRKLRERSRNQIKDKEIRIRRIKSIRKQPEKLSKLRKQMAERKAKARKSEIFKKRESESRMKYRSQIKEEKLEIKLQRFITKAKEGPTCICVCCGSLWFRSSVQKISPAIMQAKHDQNFLDRIFHVKCSDSVICRTCYSYAQKGKVPRLALSNGLNFPEIPDVLKDLTTLEERLVALRLPFLQIRNLGVDRQCGIKGNVVHIPNDLDTSVACIPRTEDQASIIPVILVRRLDHEKPYLFQMVRPVKIYEAAKYLLTTPIYKEEGATLSLDWLEKAVMKSQEL